MNLKICTTEDIDALIIIATQSYVDHYQYLWKDKGEKYIQANYNHTAFASEIVDEDIALYLIQIDGINYGFLKLNLHAAFANYSTIEGLELERIYLIKKATGKGLGNAVMRAIESIANALTKKVIWLKTMDSSDARFFYEQCGYIVCGATTLKVQGIYPQFQRQLIMEKLLS